MTENCSIPTQTTGTSGADPCLLTIATIVAIAAVVAVPFTAFYVMRVTWGDAGLSSFVIGLFMGLFTCVSVSDADQQTCSTFGIGHLIFTVSAAVFIFVPIMMAAMGPPRFLEPANQGYAVHPLPRPTAMLTRSIARDRALQAVSMFSLTINQHRDGNFRVDGAIDTIGHPAHHWGYGGMFRQQDPGWTFYISRSWVPAWVRLFPSAVFHHVWSLSFYVQRESGHYDFYIAPGDRRFIRYSPALMHGVLASMAKSLALYRRHIAQQDHRQQHRVRRAASWQL